MISTPAGALSDRIGRRKIILYYGTAFGTCNAVLGVLDFPASAIAGVLWQGIGGWQGFGPPAPFVFGGVLARLAALMLGVTGIGRAPRPMSAAA